MYSAAEVIEVVQKALDPTNRYHAAERLGREATVVEAVRHYLQYAPPLIHVQEFYVQPTSGDEDAPLFI